MDLSIIIVHYKTQALTQQTIEAVLNSQTRYSYEIIVVDNASSDGSLEYLIHTFKNESCIRFIANPSNLGFSIANNRGITESTGDFILLLNSDTVVETNVLETCLEYMHANPQIGGLGCRLLLPNGQLDHTCKRGFPTPEASLYYFTRMYKLFPNSKRFGQYTQSFIGSTEIGEVDALVGAFMMIPRSVLNQTGLLDENFFMYGEDLDLCYRIKEKGYKIVYYPKVTTLHLKGQSSKKGKKKNPKALFEFYRAMTLFYDKHYLKRYPFWVTFLVHVSIRMMGWMACTLNGFRK